MRAIEVSINCRCGGAISHTSLFKDNGTAVAFWLTEDEKILMRGYCSKCGEVIEWRYSILTLLFDCPTKQKLY